MTNSRRLCAPTGRSMLLWRHCWRLPTHRLTMSAIESDVKSFARACRLCSPRRWTWRRLEVPWKPSSPAIGMPSLETLTMGSTRALLACVTLIGKSEKGSFSIKQNTITIASLSSKSVNISPCAVCRWATNPVVKVAQEEKQISFPLEIDMPWSFIQRRFDITSPSGNIMANAVCNLDTHGKVVYPVNEGMSDTVRSTELAWSRIFYDSEVMVG